MYRFFYRPDTTTNFIAIITIIILAFFATYLMTNRAKKHSPVINPMVEVLEVKTSRIIKRISNDENISCFYVDIFYEGHAKVLFLQNLFVNDKESENSFPNTDFEITRNPDTQEIFEVKTKGRSFKPEKTLNPFTEMDFEENRIPEDCEILDTTIDAIK